MFIPILDALITKLLKSLDLVKKYDCLRKMKNVVVCLCMIWELCDSDQTTSKQRASKMVQNQWKKRDKGKWKMLSSVYAYFGKSEISMKVPINRVIEKTKSPFLILHCWEAFMNLIAGSLKYWIFQNPSNPILWRKSGELS